MKSDESEESIIQEPYKDIKPTGWFGPPPLEF